MAATKSAAASKTSPILHHLRPTGPVSARMVEIQSCTTERPHLVASVDNAGTVLRWLRRVRAYGLRTVWEYNIELDTSIGHVSGVLWSDGQLGIGSPVVNEMARRGVSTPAELAIALEGVGLPRGEADELANAMWSKVLQKIPSRHRQELLRNTRPQEPQN